MAPKRKFEESSETKEKTISENLPIDTENKIHGLRNTKIVSWNVDGLRAWLKKGGINIFKDEDADIVCIQETKCSDNQLPKEIKTVNGYKSYFFPARQEGYSGVALFSKKEPLSLLCGIDDEKHDSEGRYVPNAGRKLVTLDKRLDWDVKFRDYLKNLDAKKPVILCGDLNVAHNEIDLANPKTNKRNAGFTKEERDGFSTLLETGFIDTFRKLYPEKADQYTFWTYMSNARARNIGWRLDYFIISERLFPDLCDSTILSSVLGSDHCPIVLFMKF